MLDFVGEVLGGGDYFLPKLKEGKLYFLQLTHYKFILSLIHLGSRQHRTTGIRSMLALESFRGLNIPS
jgi:hypothetical protein